MNIFKRHRSRTRSLPPSRLDGAHPRARDARDVVLSDPMTSMVLRSLR